MLSKCLSKNPAQVTCGFFHRKHKGMYVYLFNVFTKAVYSFAFCILKIYNILFK